MMIEMLTVKLEGNTKMCCVGREHYPGGLLNELINSVKKPTRLFADNA